MTGQKRNVSQRAGAGRADQVVDDRDRRRPGSSATMAAVVASRWSAPSTCMHTVQPSAPPSWDARWACRDADRDRALGQDGPRGRQARVDEGRHRLPRVAVGGVEGGDRRAVRRGSDVDHRLDGHLVARRLHHEGLGRVGERGTTTSRAAEPRRARSRPGRPPASSRSISATPSRGPVAPLQHEADEVHAGEPVRRRPRIEGRVDRGVAGGHPGLVHALLEAPPPGRPGAEHGPRGRSVAGHARRGWRGSRPVGREAGRQLEHLRLVGRPVAVLGEQGGSVRGDGRARRADRTRAQSPTLRRWSTPPASTASSPGPRSTSPPSTRPTPRRPPATRRRPAPRRSRSPTRLGELQDILWARQQERVLVVLQGIDTSGKGGTVRKVFGAVNPAGLRVTSFNVPTEDELARDYLWRVHAQRAGQRRDRRVRPQPLRGRARRAGARAWCPRSSGAGGTTTSTTSSACSSDEGTTVVKVFLHLSKDEQKERLQARLDEPTKRLEVQDLGPRGPGAVGRLGRRLRGGDPADEHRPRAVARDPRRQEVVPGLGGGVD